MLQFAPPATEAETTTWYKIFFCVSIGMFGLAFWSWSNNATDFVKIAEVIELPLTILITTLAGTFLMLFYIYQRHRPIGGT